MGPAGAMGGQAAGQVVGGMLNMPFSIASSFLGAKEAKNRRERLMEIANMPGIDTRQVAGEALGDILGNMDLTEDVVGQFSDINREQRQQTLREFIPGYEERTGKMGETIDSFLAGEVPDDVAAQVHRNAAVQSLGGGYGMGSGMGRNLFARDLGMTSLGLVNQGMSQAGQFHQQQAGFAPQEVRAEQYAGGLTPAQQINLRSNERAQKISMLLSQASAPTGREMWASGLTDMGKAFQAGSQTGATSSPDQGFGMNMLGGMMG